MEFSVSQTDNRPSTLTDMVCFLFTSSYANNKVKENHGKYIYLIFDGELDVKELSYHSRASWGGGGL